MDSNSSNNSSIAAIITIITTANNDNNTLKVVRYPNNIRRPRQALSFSILVSSCETHLSHSSRNWIFLRMLTDTSGPRSLPLAADFSLSSSRRSNFDTASLLLDGSFLEDDLLALFCLSCTLSADSTQPCVAPSCCVYSARATSDARSTATDLQHGDEVR